MPDQLGNPQHTHPFSETALTQLLENTLILTAYDILRNEDDDLLFQIPFSLSGSNESACFHYNGGEHGLLCKNNDRAVLCTFVHPDLRALLRDKRVICISEGEPDASEEEECYLASVLNTPNTDETIQTLLKWLSNDTNRQRSGNMPTTGSMERIPQGEGDSNDDDFVDEDACSIPGFRFGNLLMEDPHVGTVLGILAESRQLVGVQPFKDYLEEWVRMRPLLRPFRKSPECPVEHQLFAIDPGSGCTTALSLLSRLMAVDGPFCGRDGLYGESWQCKEEWLPDEYTGSSDFDIDVKQFIDGLLDHQPGLVALYMSHWLDKLHTPQFSRILAACAALRHRIQFVFIIPFVDSGILSRVHARLSDQLNVRVIPFPPHTDAELTAVVRQRLNTYGYEWDPSADEGFAHLLRAEKHDLRFYGIRTAHKLVTELLLKKLQQSAGTGECKHSHRFASADFTEFLAHGTALAKPSGFDKLDALLGLQSIKRRLREIVGALRLQCESYGRGTAMDPPCLHMLFTGPPGTGKTEVARILGQILREENLLPQGDLIEATRFDMVGQYIGQTGPKTIQLCQSAIGSILFIDEAYLLAAGNGDGDNGDFGREALGALIAEMENNRDRLMIILAGYQEEMENLFRMNPGLRDRVPHHLHFEPYDRDILCRIALRQLQHGQAISSGAVTLIEQHFHTLPAQFLRQRDFGNARYVRNLTERVRMKSLLRCGLQTNVPLAPPDILSIDVESALAELQSQPDGQRMATRRFGF